MRRCVFLDYFYHTCRVTSHFFVSIFLTEFFVVQMNDILSLRSEVKKLQALTQHLEPFVKSFSMGINAGEVSLAAVDAADNQHLQALLDHLARLQMQEPPPQAQAPTKDHRHPRSTATTADNALYMKGKKTSLDCFLDFVINLVFF